MKMQTKPVERQVSKRLVAAARGVVGVLTLGLVAALFAVLPVGEARAEKTIAHTRSRPRQALVAETEHARSGGRAGKAATSKAAAKHSSALGVRGSAKAARGTQKTARPEARGRMRSRKRSEPVDEPEPVVMHRASGARVSVSPTVRTVARNVPVRSKRAPVARVEVAAEPAKTLTVDDFVRAASPNVEDVSGANGKMYVRGESRTEEDDRTSDMPAVIAPKPRILALKPVAKTAAPVVARVEANPPVGTLPVSLPGSSMTMVTDSGDMTDELTTASAQPLEPATTRRSVKIAPLPLLSRQQVTEEVEQPIVLPGLYRNGRLVVPAPLKGTHEILVHQNLMADDEGLERIEDDYDLHRLRAAHLLVDYPESASLHINPELAFDRRCGRAWSVRFATNIARDFYARFHQPLQVNSAVRTVAFQVRLQRTNGNAAGIDGETASPHLTGQAMDLGKRNMSMAQIAWMRSYLLPLMQAGKVDVEEEFQQACFHVSVYRSYMPDPAVRRAPRVEVAQLREPRVKAAARRDELR